MTKSIIWTAIVIVVILLVVILFTFMNGPAQKSDKGGEPTENSVVNTEVASSATPDYVLDIKKSVITWTGRRPILEVEHTGTFKLFSGGVFFEDGVVKAGNFVIDMQSIMDDGSGVVNHLRSGDWFDVETYPKAIFVITDFSDTTVTGDLKIKDVTHSITFPVSIISEGDSLRATGSFGMDRTKWKVTFGSGSFFANVGDQIIDDNVRISLDLTARKTTGQNTDAKL